MELQIVSEEMIKPLTSTPPELRYVPLCLFDLHAPNIYLPMLYFFNNSNNVGSGHHRLLKDSLSKALTFYYPFAGTLHLTPASKHLSHPEQHGSYIECNDMGVMFLVAKAGSPMTDVMNDKDSQREEKLKLLLLDDMNKKEQEVKPMLSIQLTQFECGGEVICVFFNHKLSDMYSVTHFMRDWASIARSFTHGDLPVVNPQFNGATCFPPELEVSDNPSGRQDTSGTNERVEVPLSFSKFCSKRLVFEGSKIAALKAMVSEKADNPTRVQLIAALIYKAVLSAKSSLTGCVDGATQLHLMINLRQRVEPPLPRLIGNIMSRYIASETRWEQRDKEVWDIVGGMKKSLKEFCQKFPRDYKNKEWGRLYKLHAKQSMERLRNKGDVAVISCSSWCRFPVYDVDFGWGKAVWVSVPEFPAKDLILLMDTKDGEGIEAMVSLEEKAMEAFQQNQEFFSFCELKK